MKNLSLGARALLRGRLLRPPVVIDHIRSHFMGEPEANGPVFWHYDSPGYAQSQQRCDQCQLIPLPEDYELPPTTERCAAAAWFAAALDWLHRNRKTLIDLHGAEAVAQHQANLQRLIKEADAITEALATEPEATPMRRAEIALAVSAKRPVMEPTS